MHRVVILLGLAAAACGSAPPTSPSGSGTRTGAAGGPAIYAKKISLSWALQPSGSGTEVFLQTTDETGKQVSYSLGTFEGNCTPRTPAAAMKAVMGLACGGAASPIELHAVVHDREVVVLKLADPGPGHQADPMSRQEIHRIIVPSGAGIEVAP